MAVQEQTPYIEYTSNGITTSFALEFDCEKQEHLIVLVDDVEPVVGAWSLSNGAVVFNTAPENGKKITIQRNTPFSRTTDYQSYNNSFRPPAVNKDFDWIWWKLQELGVADWILSNRIDDLKNYVDDRDDELRAYLLEEIRKQGVALDQLDEYYNYLMQRLAQIAVDKGWDASFIVDASGKTQQQVNDDQALLNTNQSTFNSRFTNSKDKPTLQEVINTIDTTTNIIKRGEILFNPLDEIDVATQLEVDKARINFDGRNALIKWTGTDSTKSIFRVTDSSYTKFKDLILIGNATNPPLAALFFDNVNGMNKGTNEKISVENVVIGRKYLTDTDSGGSANTGTPYGRVQNGIVVGGTFDGNNDEYYLNNVVVNDAVDVGIDFRNTQSIWSSINNTLVNVCPVGVKVGCNLTMYNPQFNRCATADVHGIRNTESTIIAMQSENAKIFVWSQGGASFTIIGGELQKNTADDGDFFRFEQGGRLCLTGGLFVENNNTGKHKIYYRAGSSKKGSIYVRECTIQNGSLRDTWDINTAANGAQNVIIDIEHDDFHFKTNAPYFDERKTSFVATANASGLTSSTAATKIGYGKFTHASLGTPLGSTLQVPVCLDTSTVRVRVLNRAATDNTIPTNNVRVMDLSGHILGSAKSAATTLNFTARGVVKVDIALFGVRKGDYIIPSSDNLGPTMVMTAYASADNIATVLVETMATAASTVNDIVLSAAKFNERLARYHGLHRSVAISLANNASTSFNVNVVGAQVGSHCLVSCSEDLNGICATAHCNEANVVTVVLHNRDSTTKTLPEGVWFKVCAIF